MIFFIYQKKVKLWLDYKESLTKDKTVMTTSPKSMKYGGRRKYQYNEDDFFI